MYTAGNLWVSEIFQHSSALPNIKYNFAVLILSQLLFIYASKYIVKSSQNFLISSKKTKFTELPGVYLVQKKRDFKDRNFMSGDKSLSDKTQRLSETRDRTQRPQGTR